jgi:hypothetical protein
MSETCLLCKERKVYQIKSHLTPAGITENTYGERNKEVIYTIDPENKTVEKYYGREYPQEETTEIKDEPNVRRGIFCKVCETDFGTYESAVQNKLNEFINSIGHTAEIKRTGFYIKYSNLDFHPNVLITFFLSIVWRQCIEQILDGMDNPISDEELEALRVLVLQKISTSINEIIEQDIIQNPKMSIFTTYDTKTQPTWANPHPKETNPQIFFIGPIVLLYKINQNVTDNFKNLTLIDKGLLDDNISLQTSRIGIIHPNQWTKISNKMARNLVRQFMR